MKTKLVAGLLLLVTSDLAAQIRDSTLTQTIRLPVWVKRISVPCLTAGSGGSSTGTYTTVAILPVCPGGFELRAKVTLERPAPAPYIQINVSSTDPTHAPAPPIRIYEGLTEGTSLIRSTPVAANTPVTVAAWTNTEDRKTDAFTLVPPSLTKIELSPTTVVGGASPAQEVQGTLTFNGPPAHSTAVHATFATTNGSVNPYSAYLPVSSMTLPFVVKNVTPVATITEVTVTATSGSVSKPGLFKVRPPVLGWPNYGEMGYCNSSSCECWGACRRGIRVVLDGAAPAGGLTLKVESSNPALVQVPATAFIPAGSQSVGFPADVPSAVSSSTNATVTVSGTSTLTKPFTVKPQKNGDLRFKEVTFTDRYGQAITSIADSYPVTMCAKVLACGGTDSYGSPTDCPSHEPRGAVMSVEYTSNTGVGRSWTVPIDFGWADPPGLDAYSLYPSLLSTSICAQIPGLNNPGDSYDIKLLLDATHVINETTQSNNDKTLHISRPSS